MANINNHCPLTRAYAGLSREDLRPALPALKTDSLRYRSSGFSRLMAHLLHRLPPICPQYARHSLLRCERRSVLRLKFTGSKAVP